MKLKEGLDIIDLVEHLDKIIDHEGAESPVVSITNGLGIIGSRDEIEAENGECAIFFGVKKYTTMIDNCRKQIIKDKKK